MDTKPIPRFPFYLVTSAGQILSERRGGRVMRPGRDKWGYCRQPMIRDDGRIVCNYVHRLVALAFLPAPGPGQEIDHIDGNAGNNAAANLRWIDHRANIGAAIARRGNWLAAAPRRRTPITRIDQAGAVVRYRSICQAVDALNAETVAAGGVARSYQALAPHLSRARVSGREAYGYHWHRR